jgi:hypothetical protein
MTLPTRVGIFARFQAGAETGLLDGLGWGRWLHSAARIEWGLGEVSEVKLQPGFCVSGNTGNPAAAAHPAFRPGGR